MSDSPPTGPTPGRRVAPAGRATATPGSRPGRRARRRQTPPAGESALFIAIGVVVGVVASVLVLHGGGPGAPVAATGAAQARSVTSTGTATSSSQAGSALPVGSRSPVASRGPAQIGLLHVRPVAVTIPAIKVSSPLVDLGLNADGSLQVPSDFAKAGWYSGGPYPGDADGPPALIAGHIDDYHGPAVFYRLQKLHVGDSVYVKRADGSTATFVIYRTGNYLKSRYPASSIYQPTPAAELRLITCTGRFDDTTRSYLSDFVAFARLARPKANR